jgi:hypothetical protein
MVVYCPPKPVLAGCIADKTPHFVLVNRSTFNRNTALALVEIIIIDLPYPRVDTPQIIGNGILGYSQGSGRCPRPAPVDYRKKYARADSWYHTRQTSCAGMFDWYTKNAVCRSWMSRFSLPSHFRNADMLPVLIPLEFLPIFALIVILACFLFVFNTFRPLPRFHTHFLSVGSPISSNRFNCAGNIPRTMILFLSSIV